METIDCQSNGSTYQLRGHATTKLTFATQPNPRRCCFFTFLQQCIFIMLQKKVPDFNSWCHRSSNVQTLSTVYNHLFFFCDSGLILEVNEPSPKRYPPSLSCQSAYMNCMLSARGLNKRSWPRNSPPTNSLKEAFIFYISNISLTTARKLSLISLGQTRLQLDPNPWMMNLVSRLVLKWDSTTLQRKTIRRNSTEISHLRHLWIIDRSRLNLHGIH